MKYITFEIVGGGGAGAAGISATSGYGGGGGSGGYAKLTLLESDIGSFIQITVGIGGIRSFLGNGCL